MKKRIISVLLVLSMLFPFGTAFAANAMGDVRVTAHSGQTVTLTASHFADALDLDPADEDLTLYHISFPTLPAANQAVIYLNGTAYAADTAVPIADIGDLQVRIEAMQGATVQIPFHATLSNDEVLYANLIITVLPQLQNMSYTVTVGESVSIILWTAETGATITLEGDNNLQHGTLQAVAGEPGVFTYHATSEGTDSFRFTVTINGVTSEPATVTITVTPPAETPYLRYYDMPSHWAAFSAGRLAILDKVVGHRVDDRYFFHPYKAISRGDFIIWLLSVMGIEPMEHTNTIYADPDIPSWMRGFINAATEEGIVQGVPAESPATTSYIFPHNPITRIEAIRMVSMALGVEGHDDDLADLF